MALNLTHDGLDDTPVGADSQEPARPTFAELYDDADAPMLRFAALLVDTIDDAEHVVQDASVKSRLHRAITTLRQEIR